MTWPPGQPPPPPGVPQPPPLPYPPEVYGQPPTPRKSRRALVIGLSLLGVFLVTGIVAAIVVIANDGTAVAKELNVGDCIADVPLDSRVLTLPTIDCGQPHGGEVYSVQTIDDADFPSDSRMHDVQARCPSTLNQLAPSHAPGESVGVYVLYPTRETWARGDRSVTCIATFNPRRTGHMSTS